MTTTVHLQHFDGGGDVFVNPTHVASITAHGPCGSVIRHCGR